MIFYGVTLGQALMDQVVSVALPMLDDNPDETGLVISIIQDMIIQIETIETSDATTVAQNIASYLVDEYCRGNWPPKDIEEGSTETQLKTAAGEDKEIVLVEPQMPISNQGPDLLDYDTCRSLTREHMIRNAEGIYGTDFADTILEAVFTHHPVANEAKHGGAGMDLAIMLHTCNTLLWRTMSDSVRPCESALKGNTCYVYNCEKEHYLMQYACRHWMQPTGCHKLKDGTCPFGHDSTIFVCKEDVLQTLFQEIWQSASSLTGGVESDEPSDYHNHEYNDNSLTGGMDEFLSTLSEEDAGEFLGGDLEYYREHLGGRGGGEEYYREHLGGSGGGEGGARSHGGQYAHEHVGDFIVERLSSSEEFPDLVSSTTLPKEEGSVTTDLSHTHASDAAKEHIDGWTKSTKKKQKSHIEQLRHAFVFDQLSASDAKSAGLRVVDHSRGANGDVSESVRGASMDKRGLANNIQMQRRDRHMVDKKKHAASRASRPTGAGNEFVYDPTWAKPIDQEKYKHLRKESLELMAKRDSTFQESKDAYRRGDKAQSARLRKFWFEVDKMYKAEVAKAAMQVFELANSNPSMLNNGVVDLHGLHPIEAEVVLKSLFFSLEGKLKAWEAHDATHRVKVITGAGRHSRGNVGRLLPSVKDFLLRESAGIGASPVELPFEEFFDPLGFPAGVIVDVSGLVRRL